MKMTGEKKKNRVCIGNRSFWFVVIAVLACIPFSLGRQASMDIEVGICQFPPLVQYDPVSGYEGLVIDILNDIAEKENWNLHYSHYVWGGCLDHLRNKSIDMLCLVADLPERREYADFNRELVYLDWGQVWTRPDSSIENLDDLHGRTVAGIKEDVFSSKFKKVTKDASLDCLHIEVDSYEQLVEMLHEGAIDAAILNRMFNPDFFNMKMKKTRIIFAATPLSFGFPKNVEKNHVIIQALDKHLKKMKAEGDSAYYRAVDKWIHKDSNRFFTPLFWLILFSVITILIILTVILSRLRKNLNAMSQKRLEAEKNYFRLFNTINDGLLVFKLGIDGIPGKITQVNKQVCLILGCDEKTIKNKSIYDLIDPSEKNRVPVLINDLISHKDQLFQLKLYSSDKISRNVEIHANLIDDSGQWKVFSVIRDISERANLEQEFMLKHAQLQKKYEQNIQEIQRISREQEVFAGTVSHDIQSPLKTIEGIVNRIRNKCSRGNTNAQEEIEQIYILIQRINALVRSILEYNRLTRKDIEINPVVLSQVCSEVLLRLDLNIRERDADVTIERPMPSVMSNEEVLSRIIQNLLANAIKFVEFGKKPKVILRAEKQGKTVRLWIIDNGIGIAPEYQEQIFELFQRLHGIEEYPGSGMGLAIVQRAVERLNGKFGLISDIGEGSRFWIDLPVDPTES